MKNRNVTIMPRIEIDPDLLKRQISTLTELSNKSGVLNSDQEIDDIEGVLVLLETLYDRAVPVE